ncbi:LysR family glycine cleavage system transcriptional activator [Herbaspirillum sp. Sphag1AN]|uniref:LysR substrate-binding domain-containing protein n=1 Tax=unclassified Herbaspirillum TaxID=2624150 RepID=UPI0016136060|nr:MULTISPECIES: LysR substrate-binding domain-containing protein [unclassified Herbaspirillum]MBB3212241.1 LysR family glycine cleavage system transcriptional activator [Herbaspirillum sp. Sphag1AN]MBB3245661.1 LysR family glycine cleavage system transcriptional activator [Herbaspirillum sp. Sphag64]
MHRLPPLNSLRSFEAAGRLKSLTKAADELSVTHSAVAQQIHQLESYLGQNLFDRQGRALVLTPRARHFLVDVSGCLSRLAAATEQMRANPARRKLRVSASISFAHGWLLPQLAAFHARHPDIDVELVTSPDFAVDQLDETCDALIRRHQPNLRRIGFVSKLLVPNRAIPVCSPGFLASHALHQPGDLRPARLLHFAGLPEMWQCWFHAAGVTTSETLAGPVYDHFLLLMQAAESGIGIGLAPQFLVAQAVAEGKLLPLFPEVMLQGPPFYCLYRDTPDDADLELFLNWLLEAGQSAQDICMDQTMA